MRRTATILLVVLATSAPAWGHQIPNARVDRSIQATLRPGRLAIDYQVGLSELTLTRDLRDLVGTLPGAEPRDLFDRYGREVGPLNAKGLLIAIDGRPVELRTAGFDLVVEEHPQYTFHFESPLPPSGRLAINDTNYTSSEGTSRLAVRGEGVSISGDDLPADVAEIPIRPVWQLSDSEERRTKEVAVDFHVPAAAIALSLPPAPPPERVAPSRPEAPARLSRLLDRAPHVSLFGLLLIALGLGAAHAIQPGHGKTLVAATVVGEGGSWLLGAILAAITTLTHTGSVLVVAAGLWLTRSSRYGAINTTLVHVAGFAIAAIGLWRLGRHLAGYGEHGPESHHAGRAGMRGIVGLGVAGGLVPCWDAVALIVVAEAVGRLGLGILLLLAFGLGMAAVLTTVGAMAARLRRVLARREAGAAWARRLGIVSGLALSAIGVYLLAAP